MMILTVHTHMMKKQPNSYAEEDFIENRNKKREGFFFHKKKKNKRIIIVDDDEDILFTYRSFSRRLRLPYCLFYRSALIT